MILQLLADDHARKYGPTDLSKAALSVGTLDADWLFDLAALHQLDCSENAKFMAKIGL